MKYKFMLKTMVIVTLVLIASFNLEAQVPQGINYQAILRNSSGAIMKNQNVTLKFTIHQTTTNGTTVYEETQGTTTNDLGLVNLQIGKGSPTIGVFSEIQWGTNSFFLQGQVDTGTGYINLGTTQFASVPYALVADTVLHGGSNSTNLGWNLTGNSGTNPTSNFVGTTDAKNLVFKVNNQPAGLIDQTNANVFYGYQAGKSNTTGSGNTFIGYKSGLNSTTRSGCVFIGQYSGFSTQTSQGSDIFIGSSAGYSNTTGFDNLFIGAAAGYYNTTGHTNHFFGHAAGYANTTGRSNTFMGAQAGYSNTIADNNTFVGYTTGHSNTIGENNSFFGHYSGYSNVDGSNNTFIGESAGFYNTNNSGNVCLGVNAGSIANGNNNTFIGYLADANTAGYTNATAIGANAIVSSSNSLILGNNVNVGIGTSSPTSKLEINGGGIRATLTSGTGLYANITSGSAYGIWINHNGTGNLIEAIANNSTNGSNAMIIQTYGTGRVAEFDNFNTGNLNAVIYLSNAGTGKYIDAANGAYLSNSGNWVNSSDINLKEHFEVINGKILLSQIDSLSITKWNYKSEGEKIKHIGPMAQQFNKLFGTGSDDKSISTIDPSGVALAGIKELHTQLIEQQQLIEQLQKQVVELQLQLEKLNGNK